MFLPLSIYSYLLGFEQRVILVHALLPPSATIKGIKEYCFSIVGKSITDLTGSHSSQWEKAALLAS